VIPATGWTCEVHELSEGFSAIVYDEHGQMVADHLDEDRALLIASAPDMLALLIWLDRIGGLGLNVHERIRGVIASATGIPS